MVMAEQRAHQRTPIQVRMRLTTRDGVSVEATTWNLSEGGTFVEMSAEQKRLFNIGSRVTSQVQGLPSPAPKVVMRVVRHSPNGIGLKIEQDDD